MELLDTLQLGGKRQLMMVSCDGQRYLVGVGADSVQSIAEMSSHQTSSLEPFATGEPRSQVKTETVFPNEEPAMGWSH